MFIKNKPSAFTLIELSAVVAIIGILIAGVMTANGLVKKSKIAAAQSLTKASPINGIQNNDLWLESSQESSFKDNESSSGDVVTTWYDQKNATNKSLITVVGTGPIYSNTINYIHAVKFNGSNANYLKLEDASFLNKNSYTIFVVEKRQSNSSNNYFLGDSAQTSTNQSLLLGYSADGSVIHSQSGSTLASASTANVDSYANYNDKPRVFTFNFDTNSGSKTYINGTLSGQNTTNLTPLSNVTSLSIGKGYSGEIGEIAIFSRSLKSDERKAVEDYLAKKWSVKMTRESAASCTEGVIAENGCKKTCPVSVVGVSSPTTFSDGETRTLTCNATGYAGGTTRSYTCTNGELNPPPGAVCTTAGETTGGSSGANVCASGYEQIGSSPCQPISCTVTAPTTDGTNTTNVNLASGQITCDKTGYSGTVNYTCVGINLRLLVGLVLCLQNALVPTLLNAQPIPLRFRIK
jgi:prepilin-type N-terminal cleavage/methylation domain-containing protein